MNGMKWFWSDFIPGNGFYPGYKKVVFNRRDSYQGFYLLDHDSWGTVDYIDSVNASGYFVYVVPPYMRNLPLFTALIYGVREVDTSLIAWGMLSQAVSQSIHLKN